MQALGQANLKTEKDQSSLLIAANGCEAAVDAVKRSQQLLKLNVDKIEIYLKKINF